MSNIKVLDCTLRDGGYINQWNFGEKNIQKIIRNLEKAHIDYIECGFLKNESFSQDKSLFHNFQQLERYLDLANSESLYSLMINYGEYPVENLTECKNKRLLLRIAFRKQVMHEAIIYCKHLIEKGYDIFVNPKQTDDYSSEEFFELLNKMNELKPYAFTIVDTAGSMQEKDILNLFSLIDNNLDKNVALCFHSHNNLQLSFPNAQCLMKICQNRVLIIDSTILGIGRCAGNLCTEMLIQYLQDNYGANYDITPILKSAEEQINPIFTKTPWGYSVSYYLSALNNCHPNYAKFLIERHVPVQVMPDIFQLIPNDKKSVFDFELITNLCNLKDL